MNAESGAERVVIVGGGPAGAAAAALLGRAGASVVLLERGGPERGKVCGEGVLPPGLPVLEELGVLDALERGGARRLRGIRYVAPSGRAAKGDFPGAMGPGLAVPRRVLDPLLWEAALREPRVEGRLGVLVRGLVHDGRRVVGVSTDTGEVRGRLVIAADGLGSVAHVRAGLRCARPRRVRLGINAHWSGVSAVGEHVEVLIGSGWELYVAPQGGGSTLVAALVEGRFLERGARGVAGLYDELVRSHAGLRGRLGAARLLDEPRALGPLGLTVEPGWRPGLLALGDAAGALDPITGEGLALALRSARDVAELLAPALGGGEHALEDALRRVARRRAARLHDLRALTRLALSLSRHPALAERAVRGLARHPDVLSRLLAVACGAAPYNSIGLRDKARLALA